VKQAKTVKRKKAARRLSRGASAKALINETRKA
jgi:hypothetical protein